VSYPNRGIEQYRKFGAQSEIKIADPHRLIQMLTEGALERISRAKNFMQHNDIAEKGRHISWAISIIEGLRLSLDLEKCGEIAANLDVLYDYMNRRLVQANAENNATFLDEVVSLIREIKSGWDAIPEDVRTVARPKPSAGSVGDKPAIVEL